MSNFALMKNQDKDIQALIEAIEQAVGVTDMTSRKFLHLSASIFSRTHKMIGVTTLKRLWGYVSDTTQPRTATLDILAQFIGYRSFKDFCDLYASEGKKPSSCITFGECVYADDMNAGDTYRLTWSPYRVCDIEYQGDYTFVVVRSELTKLTEGTTFRCQVIERGQELFLDHVYFDKSQKSPLNYICGKIGGIQYENL